MIGKSVLFLLGSSALYSRHKVTCRGKDCYSLPWCLTPYLGVSWMVHPHRNNPIGAIHTKPGLYCSRKPLIIFLLCKLVLLIFFVFAFVSYLCNTIPLSFQHTSDWNTIPRHLDKNPCYPLRYSWATNIHVRLDNNPNFSANCYFHPGLRFPVLPG